MSAQSLTLKAKAANCPICEESHWHWTDRHGIARCGKCGVSSALVEGKPPKSTLKSEFLPQYKYWWRLTKGSCSFDEWMSLGKGRPSKEAIDSYRKAETRKIQAEIFKRSFLLISEGTPYIHNTKAGKREKKKRSDWNIDFRRHENGESMSYSLGYGTFSSKAQAVKGAEAMARAIDVATGHHNSYQGISVVEHEETTLAQYLKEGWRFWACHPKLKLEVNLDDDNEIIGHRAYLSDPYEHGMHVRSTGDWPDGEGKTKKESMEALCDHIRGQSIGFSGYHCGSFSAPSNLIAGK